MNRRRGRKGRNRGIVSVMVIVMIFLVVMSVQIYKLKQKDAELAEREQNVLEEIADETEYAEELEEMSLFTQSIEYVKEWAHKLGFVSDNEIIFKENGE